MGILSGHAHMAWMDHLKKLNIVSGKMVAAKTLEKQREAFALLSDQLTRTVKLFSVENKKIYQAFCPMAFGNKGAHWLQDSDKIANPYFGENMLRCGEVTEEIESASVVRGDANG